MDGSFEKVCDPVAGVSGSRTCDAARGRSARGAVERALVGQVSRLARDVHVPPLGRAIARADPIWRSDRSSGDLPYGTDAVPTARSANLPTIDNAVISPRNWSSPSRSGSVCQSFVN